MEWRVHVECALLVKSLSYFLYSNWWLRYITNNQTLITNSSLPRKNSTEYTERFFGMTYAMTKGDISWKWSVIMWTGLFRQGLVTGSTVLLEKLMRSPVPEIPRINPLKPELNPICYLLALLGAHHFLHVSRIRVKLLTFRRLMSYIYGAPILDVSRSHTTTQHSR